jgi:Core-2/I-Branching enzyme
MSLAFIITAYKQPSQFARLMDVLWHPDDHFAVHVDAKTSPEVRREFVLAAKGRSNIEFIPPVSVVWGGFGLCQAEWNALNALIRRPGWTHMMNITAQDFPLRTRERMIEELRSKPGVNHMRVLPLAESKPHFRRRFHWVCVEAGGKVRRLPIPYPKPRGFRNDWIGDGWHILTREFCEWAVTAPVAQECLRWFRRVKHPHESWYQAMMMASPFAGTVDADNKRLIKWMPNSGNPRVLTAADLPELASSSAFFARKFDETVDAEVLDRLASRLRGSMAA